MFFSNDFSTVVLGDFGISSALNEKQTVNPTKGGRTSGYAAPEVYKSFSARESDYYSFGITLWELSVGTFPFIGMTDEQVMKVTVMDELHLPESMDKRLSHLIRGLTRKDRKNRWGYEEVKRWLNGEDVGLAEETFQRNIKPYQFNGEEIYTLEGLTRAFAASWEDAKKHLYRGLVREFIQQFGEDYALKVIECEEMRDQDKGLSLLIMQVNEEVPLCWKGGYLII
ncbi:protein kinase [Thalassobacillus sp. C254]|uniref:protein kinase domain-containing protein n=1 Tax=Thalassobacillus sp. C254 TaxID=1225341 RepID=UPI0022B637C2|nr:protein kinase [Thalassobacillus sp. C254]